MKTALNRRQFIGGVSATAALFSSARSYARIIGANERVHFAAVGVNSRGGALIDATAELKHAVVNAVCDVDSRALAKHAARVDTTFGLKSKRYTDFRETLASPDVDALLIATPDHWHTPMAVSALAAGKHVYVEKPCSHNPTESALLLAAEKHAKSLKVQVGNQQRSAVTSQGLAQAIRDGRIGRPYLARCWYANTRTGIGKVTQGPVPDWLDWELWQGPAPRESFKPLYVHYDWHWFWRYGTGEINNNGLHEIDVCRWILGVDYPDRISSSGGRFHYNDAWEFYDTQVVNFTYPNDLVISWEGRSCNGAPQFGRGRGSMIYGTEGSALVDRNGVVFYDLAGKEVEKINERAKTKTTDTRGGGLLDRVHMGNFVDAIRDDTPLHSPLDDIVISNDLCHLGNYAQVAGKELEINAKTGKIEGNRSLMKRYWQREYARGWEPKVGEVIGA